MQPKLLGILAFFNMQLLSSSAGEKDRKKLVGLRRLRTNSKCKVSVCQCLPGFCPQALTSVMALMRLMGSKHISSVRVKMMTTLRTGLRYRDDFPLLCCQSVHTHTQTRKQCVNDIWCILVKPDIIIIYYTTN